MSLYLVIIDPSIYYVPSPNARVQEPSNIWPDCSWYRVVPQDDGRCLYEYPNVMSRPDIVCTTPFWSCFVPVTERSPYYQGRWRHIWMLRNHIVGWVVCRFMSGTSFPFQHIFSVLFHIMTQSPRYQWLFPFELGPRPKASLPLFLHDFLLLKQRKHYHHLQLRKLGWNWVFAGGEREVGKAR